MPTTWPPIGYPPYFGLPLLSTYQKDYKAPALSILTSNEENKHSSDTLPVIESYPFTGLTKRDDRAIEIKDIKSAKVTDYVAKDMDLHPAYHSRIPTNNVIRRTNEHTQIFFDRKMNFETTYGRDFRAYAPECYINARKAHPSLPLDHIRFPFQGLDCKLETTYSKSYIAYPKECYFNSPKHIDCGQESVYYFDDLLPALGPLYPLHFKSTMGNCD